VAQRADRVLLDVHEAFAWVVIASNALAGLWALAANWLEPLRVRALWWFVIAAEATIFVQVVLGVLLITIDDFEPPKFHMFYGFIALFTVLIVYSYRSQLQKQRYLLYGFGSLFLMGLAIRAMEIGPGR
jgi:hypothetical protein